MMSNGQGQATLLAQLSAADPQGRWRAAAGLAQVRTEAAVRGLAAALYDAEPFVRWNAAQALGEVARQASEPAVVVAATHAILEAASAPDSGARAAAADAVAAWGRSAPLEPALHLTQDGEPAVRAAAVRALGLAGNQSPQIVVPALTQSLADPDPEVRRTAVNAIAWCRDDSSRPALRARLKDPAGTVRGAALRALGKLGDPDVEAQAVAMLGDPEPAVRVETIRFLRLHGSLDCLAALLQATADDTPVANTTVGALAQEAGRSIERRHIAWPKRILRRQWR